MQEYFRSLRHELRTPLNHIVGYSELLLDAADDAGQHHLTPDLQKIWRASKELVALVDTLFAPAPVGGDKMDLDRLSHELRTPLNAIIGYSELLEEEAGNAGHDDITADIRKINSAGKQEAGRCPRPSPSTRSAGGRANPTPPRTSPRCSRWEAGASA